MKAYCIRCRKFTVLARHNLCAACVLPWDVEHGNRENPSKNEGTPRGGDKGNVSTDTVTYSQSEVNDMIACAVRAERERCATIARYSVYSGDNVNDMTEVICAIQDGDAAELYAPAVSATKPATGERETGATLKG